MTPNQEHRPWVDCYIDMVVSQRLMNAACAGALVETHLDNLILTTATRGFFVACFHLEEWLKNDLDQLLGATQEAIVDFFRIENLRVVDAMANTIKHHTGTRAAERPYPAICNATVRTDRFTW